MKRALQLIVLLVMAIGLVSCGEDLFSKEISSIVVDQSSVSESYDIESFDISTIHLVVNYTDGTSSVIQISEEYLSLDDINALSTPGTHTLSVTFQGHTIELTITLNEKLSVFEKIYQLAVSEDLISDLTYEEWLESIRGEKGDPGEDGKQVVFRVTDSHIQWSYEGDGWQNLISIDLLVGPKGETGESAKNVEFKVDNQQLQWKYVDDNVWQSLFDLSALEGENGQTPYIGSNGNWFIGQEDTGVQALGSKGDNGITPHIGENGNWFIGESDTSISATYVVENMDRPGTDGLRFQLVIENGIAGYEVTGYNGSSTDIIIPNIVLGEKVISMAPEALPETITSLSISKYMEKIPSFEDYEYLESFDFNHAPLKELPENVFKDAKDLTSISNYSNVEIVSSYAFYNTQILFNEFDFTNVTEIGSYAFYKNSVSELEFDGLIIKVENGKYEISDQTFVYLPETVESIGYRAFPSEFSIYYAGDREVEFTSDFFFKNVKKTEDGYWYVDHGTYAGILNYTGQLTEITIPSVIDGKNVTIIEKFAFIGDNHLTRINIPQSVSSIGLAAFVVAQKLYIIHIPSSIVNISDSQFGFWYDYNNEEPYTNISPAVKVFENKQEDMNFGSNDISDYDWGRYAFGYTSSEIKQDDSFVYLEKALTVEILAIKNKNGKVTIPATYNSKPIVRINPYSLIGHNGGVTFVDIPNGMQFISTHAFYGSDTLRYVNIPLSMNAVNYQGFYDLDNLDIHVKASEKPANWDSTWYYGINDVIWDSYASADISNDGLFIFELQGDEAKIIEYLGTWSSSNPLIIPESINGYTVTSIGSYAIDYTSKSSTLSIVIPSTVSTIEYRAIRYYQHLRIFSSLVSIPSGWDSSYGYNYYNSSNSDSYRSYYWQGTWELVNNEPIPS